MFCPNCGQAAHETARFCTRCGNRFTQPTTGTQIWPICLACHLKAGLIKKDAAISWISPDRWLIVLVGPARYQAVTAGAATQSSGTVRDKAMAEAFRMYAASFCQMTPDALSANFPGSISLAPAEIRQLQIIETYDADTHHYNEYTRFILDSPVGTFRGAIERETPCAAILPHIRSILGPRYTFRTTEAFPFL